MEFLLLLTAFLASLTGSGSADRQLRQVQGVAVVHAAETAQAAVQPARRAAPAVAVSQAVRVERGTLPAAASTPLAGQHFPFERRLE